MIVSASYRTDIPAYYAEWFKKRLKAGYCKTRNPYNQQVTTIRLDPAHVTGFVFWTKNVAPFIHVLNWLKANHPAPFMVSYTVTGAGRAIEPGIPPAERGALWIRELSYLYGPDAVVWRYDPILFTSEHDAAWHRENFARIAWEIDGAADEVTVSFATIYQKTKWNTDAAARQHGFTWRDPALAEKRALIADLVPIAASAGMRLTVCSQPELVTGGAGQASCVDRNRLSRIAGHKIEARIKGNRDGCACAESRDIGAYETCTGGCSYCYAVTVPDNARRHRREHHNPDGEFLLAPAAPPPAAESETFQPALF